MKPFSTSITGEYLHLPVSDRLALVTAIWDSIAAETPEAQDAINLHQQEIAELDRRLAAHQQDPSTAIAWEEVRAKLFANTL